MYKDAHCVASKQRDAEARRGLVQKDSSGLCSATLGAADGTTTIPQAKRGGDTEEGKKDVRKEKNNAHKLFTGLELEKK